MLRTHRSANGEVVFTLSGRLGSEHIAELEKLIYAEASGLPLIVDLKNMDSRKPRWAFGSSPIARRLASPGELCSVCPRVDYEVAKRNITNCA